MLLLLRLMIALWPQTTLSATLTDWLTDLHSVLNLIEHHNLLSALHSCWKTLYWFCCTAMMWFAICLCKLIIISIFSALFHFFTDSLAIPLHFNMGSNAQSLRKAAAPRSSTEQSNSPRWSVHLQFRPLLGERRPLSSKFANVLNMNTNDLAKWSFLR